MNAPRTKSETLAHLTAELAVHAQCLIDAQQPHVSTCGNGLIASGVRHGDLLLDFYGEYFEGDGHLVTGVALQGQRFDLCDLFTAAQIEDFQAMCDRHNDRDDAAEARDAALDMRGEA
jgi:hypothetical protein